MKVQSKLSFGIDTTTTTTTKKKTDNKKDNAGDEENCGNNEVNAVAKKMIVEEDDEVVEVVKRSKRRKVLLDEEEEEEEEEEEKKVESESGREDASNHAKNAEEVDGTGNDEARDGIDDDVDMDAEVEEEEEEVDVKERRKSLSKKASGTEATELSLQAAERLLKAKIDDMVKWKPGEDIPYSFLANVFEDISNESGRIIITEKLTNAFRAIIKSTPKDLLCCVYLASGTVAAPYDGLELGGTFVCVCVCVCMKIRVLRLSF